MTTAARGPAPADPKARPPLGDAFRAAFRGHPAGVAVVTADSADGPTGLTATSVASTSVDPPVLTVSVSDRASNSARLQQAETVVVHLLGAEQLELARLFSTSGVDRFADRASWRRLPGGEPLLLAAPRWIRGRVVGRLRAGAATVLAVEALEVHAGGDDAEEAGLVYRDRRWHALTAGSEVS